MKKILLFLICLLIIFLAAYGNGNDMKTTGTPESTSSLEPTNEPLSEDKLGLPYKGSELIYESNFQEEKLGDNLVSQRGFFSFAKGKLYLGSVDGGETYDKWDCVSPVFDCRPAKAYQWEFHIQFEATYPKEGGAPWDSTFIGARVSDYKTALADKDDGIWVAFSSEKKAIIYPSGSASERKWPGGAVTIDISESFDLPRKLVLVDTGSSIFYYIDKDGENILLLRIDISDKEIIVFDDQGEERSRGINYLNKKMGCYFKVFTHHSGTAIDYMAIKSY